MKTAKSETTEMKVVNQSSSSQGVGNQAFADDGAISAQPNAR